MSHLLKESGVYFLTYAEHPEHIKIGIARELKSRLQAYRTHSPFTTQVLFFVKATYKVNDPLNAKIIEKQFHEQFKHLKYRGEWFENRGALKQYIKEQKFETFLFI